MNPGDSIVSELQFTIPKSALYKNDAAILNIIAANKWKRPIYFTSLYDELGFGKYLRQDGLAYRLVPIDQGDVNQPWVVDVMMNKFKFGNAQKPGVYYDEENRRHLNSIRRAYAQAAMSLAVNGKKQEARMMLNRCDSMMLQENMPYGMVSRYQQQNQFSLMFLQAAYLAEDDKLAEKVSGALLKDMQQQASYYQNLSPNKRDNLEEEEKRNNYLMQNLQGMQQQYLQMKKPSTELPGTIKTGPAAVTDTP